MCLHKAELGDTSNKEQEVRNKITLISFGCSILVIFIHTNNLVLYGIDEKSIGIGKVTYIIETYWSLVLQVAVPMFFLISGILFFRNFEIKNLFRKWKTRIVTVLIPYVIWCSFYYLYIVMCTNIPAICSLINSSSIVELSFHNWISWLWENEYYTLWFLQNLIVYVILAPIIWLLLKNHWKKFPTGLVLLILLVYFIRFKQIELPNSVGLDMYLIGSYIGVNCRDMLYYRNKKISFCAVFFIFFVMFTAFKTWGLITEILFLGSVWYAIDLIKIGDDKLPWWMSITFFTYVAHDVFLEAFEKIVWIVFGNKSIFALLDYIFMPFVVEFFLILLAYILGSYLPFLWRILTGNRGKIYTKKDNINTQM